MGQPRHYADHAARQRAYRARQAQAQLAAGTSGVPRRRRRCRPCRHAHAGRRCSGAHRRRWPRCRRRCRPTGKQLESWQEGERGTALAEELEQVALVLDDLTALIDGASR